MRCLSFLAVGLVVVMAGAVLGLGYLGLVPSVAWAFGADRPRDLGISPSPADLPSAIEKAGVTLVSLPAGAPPGESLEILGGVPIRARFAGRELTALLAEMDARWSCQPVSEAQVRINPDGSVEVSGLAQMDRIDAYAAAVGISPEDLDSALERFMLPRRVLPFYVKGALEVEEGTAHLEVHRVELGRLTVPPEWTAGSEAALEPLIMDGLRTAGVVVTTAIFADGSLTFEGVVPETVRVSAAR